MGMSSSLPALQEVNSLPKKGSNEQPAKEKSLSSLQLFPQLSQGNLGGMATGTDLHPQGHII